MRELKYIAEIVDRLTFPELVIEIDKLGLKNISAYKIEKGTNIYRARPTNNVKFNNVNELSYNPWPKRIDRASTPSSPVFYGAISTKPEDYPMITNFAELNQILRVKTTESDEQEIAIAEFEVIDEFMTAALIFNKDFLIKNKQYETLYNQVRQVSSDNNNSDFSILEFFSDLFSYDEENKGLDYRITSAITNWIFETNEQIEAILYPSVRLDGEGTNIAIHPITVNTKLECKRIVVAKIYLKDKFVINDYISKADKINSDGSFELIDIKEFPDHLGKEYCLKKLNEMINAKS